MLGLLSLLISVPFEWNRTSFPSLFQGESGFVVTTWVGPNGSIKQSPENDWNFEQRSYSGILDQGKDLYRFRVFRQSSITGGIFTTTNVAAFFCHLYDFNLNRLHLDHAENFNNQKIDVYLCQEGTGGGKQYFGLDATEHDSSGSPIKANLIFIYDVGSLNDPLEACRELAHEYGHATLPPIHIDGGREEWANGHLGERIYMSTLLRLLEKGQISESDLFGATKVDLNLYYDVKVKPLLGVAVGGGPELKTLVEASDKAFDAFLSEACAAYEMLPIETFRRSLVLNQDQSAVGYHKALLEAMAESETLTITKPRNYTSAPWWVPVGRGKIMGTKPVAFKNGWAKIAGGQSVKIQFPKTS